MVFVKTISVDFDSDIVRAVVLNGDKTNFEQIKLADLALNKQVSEKDARKAVESFIKQRNKSMSADNQPVGIVDQLKKLGCLDKHLAKQFTTIACAQAMANMPRDMLDRVLGGSK